MSPLQTELQLGGAGMAIPCSMDAPRPGDGWALVIQSRWERRPVVPAWPAQGKGEEVEQ